jgi:hypothetical protein
LLKGLLAGGIALGVAAVFPQALALSFFVVVLGLMAGVEPGMAMRIPEKGGVGFRWFVALVFVGLGLVGLAVNPLFLAGAWFLHWAWHLLHQVTALGDGVPEGFSQFSLTFDLVVGGFVIYLWMVAV